MLAPQYQEDPYLAPRVELERGRISSGSGIKCFFANWKPPWTYSNSLPQQKFYYNYTYLTETDVT